MSEILKYKILLNGESKDAANIEYISSIPNWRDFLPVTKRSEKYHSHISSFTEQPLVLEKGARSYVKGLYESRGAFADVTFRVTRYSYDTEEYVDLVDGNLDFESYNDDEVEGTLAILFKPSNDDEKMTSRAEISTNLQTLSDFDGNAITAFSGTHGETYTLSVTATDIDGLTEAATSDCEVMLAWEVGLRLAQKILGRNDCFRSTLLNRTDGEVFQSDSDGELYYLAFTNGGLLRGGSTTDFPIRMSLDSFFDVINAITPIGVGIEEIGGEPFIVLEKIEYFYDNQSGVSWSINPPISLRFIAASERTYGRVLSGYRIYTKSNDNGVGYSSSYIDTLHAMRSWTTGLDYKTNNDYNIRINAIASSQLSEIVRNNPVSSGENDETDYMTFLFEIKRGVVLDYAISNDYSATTGVTNPSSQKNYKITPARCIYNHLKLINGCLNLEYKYRELTEEGFTGFSPIDYQEGDGNTSATTTLSGESAAISESPDLSAGVEPIFYDKDIEVVTTVTEKLYNTIQDNLKKWVRVVYNGVTYYGYIDQMEFSDLNTLRLILKFANEEYTP